MTTGPIAGHHPVGNVHPTHATYKAVASETKIDLKQVLHDVGGMNSTDAAAISQSAPTGTAHVQLEARGFEPISHGGLHDTELTEKLKDCKSIADLVNTVVDHKFPKTPDEDKSKIKDLMKSEFQSANYTLPQTHLAVREMANTILKTRETAALERAKREDAVGQTSARTPAAPENPKDPVAIRDLVETRLPSASPEYKDKLVKHLGTGDFYIDKNQTENLKKALDAAEQRYQISGEGPLLKRATSDEVKHGILSIVNQTINNATQKLNEQGPIKNTAQLKADCTALAKTINNGSFNPGLDDLTSLNNSVANLIKAMGPVKDTESVAKLCEALAERMERATNTVSADTDLNRLKESTNALIDSMGPVKHGPSETRLMDGLRACETTKAKAAEAAKAAKAAALAIQTRLQKAPIISAAINTLRHLADSELVKDHDVEGMFREAGDKTLGDNIKKALQEGTTVELLDTIKMLPQGKRIPSQGDLLKSLAKACTTTLGECGAFSKITDNFMRLAKEGIDASGIYDNVSPDEIREFKDTRLQILSIHAQDSQEGYSLESLATSTMGLLAPSNTMTDMHTAVKTVEDKNNLSTTMSNMKKILGALYKEGIPELETLQNTNTKRKIALEISYPDINVQ